MFFGDKGLHLCYDALCHRHLSKIGNNSSTAIDPQTLSESGGAIRDLKLKSTLQPEQEIEKLNFYAEVNKLIKVDGKSSWSKVFPVVTPLSATKCKGLSNFFLRITTDQDGNAIGLDVPLPAHRLKKTSDFFVQWRDKKYADAWGLNFLSEKDASKFMEMSTDLGKEFVTRKKSTESSLSSIILPAAPDSLKVRRHCASTSSLESSAGSNLSNHVSCETNLSDSGIERDRELSKPAIRKSLVPAHRLLQGRQDSLGDDGTTSINPMYTPAGYDPVEYEYLTRQSLRDENSNFDSLELSVGLESWKGTSASEKSLPFNACAPSGDNQSTVSEDLMDTRPPSAVNVIRQISTTRKAGWIFMKKILAQSRKGKLELATSRKWRKYWLTLKGVLLMFYDVDEKAASMSDLTEVSHQIDVGDCIVQAVPEYAELENVFSLSTRQGNAYYLQTASLAEVENWIHCIHSSAAIALVRQKSDGDVAVLLRSEIMTLKEKITSDEKLRKMAELQLSVEKDPAARVSISNQLMAWDSSLELQHSETFRLNCYLAAINGSPQPNPQDLLTHISRSTKQALTKIGIFSVASFHTFVWARKGEGGGEPRTKPVKATRPPKTGVGLRTKLINSFKLTDSLEAASIREKHMSKSRRRQQSDSSDAESSTSSRSKNSKCGRIGDTLYVQAPKGRTVSLPFESNLRVSQLLERVCMKEELDSIEYFLILMVENANENGLLDCTVPELDAYLDRYKYTSIKLCPKLIYDVHLTNPADHEHGAFGLAVKQVADELILVTSVDDGSQARKLGILPGDEVIEINGQDLRKLTNSFNDVIEVLNVSSSVTMTLRSSRINDPKKTLQATESMISFLVCPPPPISTQPDLSDEALSALIVPAPEEFSDSGSCRTTLSKISAGSSEARVEDIDCFLHRTEEINIMAREMNASRGDTPVLPVTLKPGVKLRKIIGELLDTEKTYVKQLKVLLERYLVPLQEENFLSRDEADLLVSNVREIYDFQTTFFESLKETVKSDKFFEKYTEVQQFHNVLYGMGEVFLQYVDKFKLYSTFCSCHSRAVKLLQVDTNQALQAFLLARNPKQQHTGSLESYLITPIQRILRYPLLMKQMLKVMIKDSEEFNCLADALTSVERVADYINEMQRISETYTPLFQDMCSSSSLMEKGDVSVDHLLHYGRVAWMNPGTLKGGSTSSRRSAGLHDAKQNECELMVFIFRKAVILLAYESKLASKKVASLSTSLSIHAKTTSDIKFYTLIHVTSLLLRDHAWSDNDTNQMWEIVDSSGSDDQEGTVYIFMNRTSEEKKVFVNAIKESIKLNKLSSSIPLLGFRNGLSKRLSDDQAKKIVKPPVLPKPVVRAAGDLLENPCAKKDADSDGSSALTNGIASLKQRVRASPLPIRRLSNKLLGKTSP